MSKKLIADEDYWYEFGISTGLEQASNFLMERAKTYFVQDLEGADMLRELSKDLQKMSEEQREEAQKHRQKEVKT